VMVADGQGGVKARVVASFPGVGEYGRRTATPDDIARINAILEQRFPTKPAPDAALARPATEAATAAPAQTLSEAAPKANAAAG
jgi:hypothetical protein